MAAVNVERPRFNLANPTWDEILKQGFFYSPRPKVLNKIPNPHQFNDLDLETVWGTFGNLSGSCGDEKSHPPAILEAVIDPMVEFEVSQGLNLDDYNVRWGFQHGELGHEPPTTKPHADWDYFDVKGYYDELPPTDYIRHFVGTIGGPFFYPGLYILNGPDFLREMSLVNSDLDKKFALDKEIERISTEKMIFPTPALTDIRFTGVHIHSRLFVPNSDERRFGLSVSFVPKQQTKLRQ